MKWFQNLPIARKLTLAFCMTGLLSLLLGGFAIERMYSRNTDARIIALNWVPGLIHLGEMRSQIGEFRAAELAQLNWQGNPAKLAEYDKRRRNAEARILAAEKEYDAMADVGESVSAPDEAALYEKYKQQRVAYFKLHQRFAAAVAAGDFASAQKISGEEIAPVRSDLYLLVDKLVDLNEKGFAKLNAASYQRYKQALLVISLCTATILLLSALLGWAIVRAIVRPLGRAVQVADAVAGGKLDSRIDNTSNDEAGQLLESMRKMQGQLQAVLAAQNEMGRQHDAGSISYRIDAAAFPGEYGAMVAGTNALVTSHIDTNAQMLALAGQYAIGDFHADMPQLPGEKARISETMATIKRNLLDISGQIQRLGSAAAAGDFSQRGEATRFQHDFRAIIESLNQLMQTADVGLGEVSRVLRAIAQGDLTQRIDGDYRGVFAQMRDDANATVAQLTDIVGRIQLAAGNINAAASEIASGNDDLSRRTEQQAAALEETAASMEELTSTVRQNAENARQASQQTQGTAGVAAQGGRVVGEVVGTMGEIEASSKRIADIISVIDGIAFQTNILALNAAVEAARAGEQGRGFAVVAGEVRTLAQRSATAAKEIKELIEDSVDKVAAGSMLVHQAGGTMSEIVTSVQRVSDIVADISAASQEQSAGIEQVNQAITQMDETTQQNAALVEEATAAAKAMEDQARELVGAVAMFKLAR